MERLVNFKRECNYYCMRLETTEYTCHRVMALYACIIWCLWPIHFIFKFTCILIFATYLVYTNFLSSERLHTLAILEDVFLQLEEEPLDEENLRLRIINFLKRKKILEEKMAWLVSFD